MTTAAEHRAVREGCGVLDRSDRGRIAISGGDRTSFLQRLLTSDVAGLRPGSGAAALLLHPKGKLLADLTVYAREDDFLLETAPGRREVVFRKLDMYTLSSDVRVADRTDGLALLGVHGPEATVVVAGLAEGAVPGELFATTAARVAGAEALLARVDYLGEEGVDLHFPAGSLDAVREALVGAGAVPIGAAAADSLRIEAGVARFGAELTEDLLPPEVPALVERAVSYTKGCFVGQETIARIKTYGHVNRELRGLVVRGDRAPDPGAEVRVGEKVVGAVTSSATPPAREHPIALAFLRRAHLDPGTEVEVDGVPATVVMPGEWG